ncbi:MAG: hypothetical protein ACI9G1_000408 [Pirellulaceae bacterium]|jgi:hypothetical protein
MQVPCQVTAIEKATAIENIREIEQVRNRGRIPAFFAMAYQCLSRVT